MIDPVPGSNVLLELCKNDIKIRVLNGTCFRVEVVDMKRLAKKILSATLFLFAIGIIIFKSIN